MYVEDALGHEKFMKCITNKETTNIGDTNLSSFLSDAVEKHTALYNKFLNLLQEGFYARQRNYGKPIAFSKRRM